MSSQKAMITWGGWKGHEPEPCANLFEKVLAEDGFEVYLPITGGAETAGAIDPALVATIDTGPARWIELGIFDMEGFDTLVIKINELNVVELLQ